jgi:UDP-N-acetylglucosamine--N-acetylmuramyl-(pentapeptide) pyrophosphoryl-undecaprenol N-acetylglucosamine transferase
VKATLAGGGTAGHVFPALAVGRELADRGVDVEFVGTAAGPEGRIVRDAGFAFREAEAVAVTGRSPLRKAEVPWKLYRAINSCVPLVESSDVVVGMGGYVSVPTVAAAVRLRRPVVLHEQNSVPGLANRWLARPARVVALSFAETVRSFPRRVRTEVTGNPVREGIAAVRDQRAVLAKEAAKELDLDEGRRTVLIFGGSQGARRINEATTGAIARLADRSDLQIVFAAGPKNIDDARAAVPATDGLIVRLFPFVERMDLALAAADLAVCRSGATTVAEVTCCGVPAILVPYPHHRDRQQELNARILQRAGAAVMLSDEDLTADLLAGRIGDLLGDGARLQRMGARAELLGRPDAAAALADVIEREAAA